jgi:hypothetical protein
MGPGGPGGFLGAEVLAPGHVVKNAPFSGDVVTTSTQTLSDGSHIKQSNTVHVYRDSEGRTRREETINFDGASGTTNTATQNQMVFINDPVTRTNYALNMGNRSATKTGRGPRPDGPPPQGQAQVAGAGRGPRPQFMQGRGRQNAANVKTESLGTQMFDGVQAQGTRITRTIPAGQIGNDEPLQIVTETWYAPDLQMVVMRKTTDPRRGETVTQVSNINRSEPASTLFQVPVDFKMTEGRGEGRGMRPRQ